MLDVPLAILGPAIILLLSVASVIPLLLVRRYVLPRLRVKESDSEFIGAMVQSVMVFYGLALALIAVNVWQTYNDVSRIVSQEATASPRSTATSAATPSRSADDSRAKSAGTSTR